MANRLQWDPQHRVGNAVIDEQHQDILARCRALADCLDEGGEEVDRKFDENFRDLMARAREHFAAEEALLTSHGYGALDDHRSEQEEFNYLAADVMTTANFDRSELQTFVTLWWAGHIAGSADSYRACFAGQP